jgi:hypothetical protein
MSYNATLGCSHLPVYHNASVTEGFVLQFLHITVTKSFDCSYYLLYVLAIFAAASRYTPTASGDTAQTETDPTVLGACVPASRRHYATPTEHRLLWNRC